jgi:hypothetical protein
LVRSSTGVWLVNRRQAGIWIRKNNTGVRATDWEYGGDYPVNSVNGQTGNVSLGSSDVAAEPIDYTVVTSAQTLINGAKVAADTTAGAFTLTLPATPSNGDTITVLDYAGTFDTNNLTIARNGSNIESLAEDMTCNVEDAAFTLVFVGSTVGWKVVPYYGTAISATEPADDVFRVVGSADSTKKLAFEVDGITSGQTRTLTVPDSSGTIALTGQLTDTQIFTANGTWTKPAGAKMLQVELVGGGGGGGGGRRGAAGTARGGGGGGAGAGHTVLLIDPESLSGTETVTVGAGGVGGTAAGNDTNGGAGAAGGDTTFGPLKAFGGNGGAGGNNTAQAAGGASASVRGFIINSSHNTAAGGSGGYEAASAGAGTGSTNAGNIWPASGGGGSRITSANGLHNSAPGGAIGSGSGGINPHIVAGGASPNAGNKGIAGGRLGFIGAGASGGRQGNAGEGAEGGDAILGGGGGGGAGATNDAGGSNAGGKGGDGIAVITTYF